MRATKKKCSRLRRALRERSKRVRHLTSKEQEKRLILSNLKNYVSPGFLVMLMAELRNRNRKGQGRRYTEMEKTLAASLYHKSRRLYNFLRRFIRLPTWKTLKTYTKKASFHPGKNGAVIELLTKMAGKFSSEEQQCVLILDEVSLKR